VWSSANHGIRCRSIIEAELARWPTATPSCQAPGEEESVLEVSIRSPSPAARVVAPAGFLQGLLLVLALAVVAGTLFDIVHRAAPVVSSLEHARVEGTRAAEMGGGRADLDRQTALVGDAFASGEFCNPERRVAHPAHVPGSSSTWWRRWPGVLLPHRRHAHADPGLSCGGSAPA